MLTVLNKASQYIFHERRRWFLASVSVVATLLLVNITIVVGKHSAIWDAADLGCPAQILLADYAWHGEWLLWTPLLSGGCPMAMDPGAGSFSPITIGIAFLTGGHEWGYRAYWLAIWGFGGIGIVVLARYFSAPRWAAYIAAVGFMFSGVYTGHAEHTGILYTMSFVPWIVWRLDAAIRRKSLLAAAQAGALCGLSALGGYAGLVIINCFFVGLWMLVALLPRDDDRSDAALPEPQRPDGFAIQLLAKLWLLARTAIVFYSVAIVVMSPSYLGFVMEIPDYSDRADVVDRDMAVGGNALTPKSLITSVSPYFVVLKRFDAAFLPGPDVSMCSVYVFPVLLILAVLALWQRPRDKFRWCLALLAALFLALALGGTLPVRGWLYDWLLPMRYFRHNGLFRCSYVFCMILLALIACRDIEAIAPKGYKSWKTLAVLYSLAAAIAIGSFVLICAVGPLSPGGRGYLVTGIIHLVVIWPGIAVAIWLGCRKDAALRDRTLKRYLVCFAVADAVLMAILCKPVICADRAGMRWDQEEARHVSKIDAPGQGLDRVPINEPFPDRNSCLISKQAVLSCYNPFVNKFYRKTTENAILSKPALGTNRFWFARQAAQLPLSEEAFDRFARHAEAMQSPSLIVSLPTGTSSERAAEYLKSSNKKGTGSEQTTSVDAQKHDREVPVPFLFDGAVEGLPPLEPLTVESIDMKSRELNLDVQCPERGWILVTDRWARGWTATVNGREQPIAIGNFIFRALAVEKGRNRLHFSYCPFGYPWLLIASWLCWGGVFAATACFSVRATRSMQDEKGSDKTSCLA